MYEYKFVKMTAEPRELPIVTDYVNGHAKDGWRIHTANHVVDFEGEETWALILERDLRGREEENTD